MQTSAYTINQHPAQMSLSIRHKLIAMIMGVSATALILAGALIVLGQMKVFRQNMVVSHLLQTRIIANNSQAAVSFEDANDADLILRTLASRPDIAYASVNRADRSALSTYRRKGFDESPQAPPSKNAYSFSHGWLVAEQPVKLDGRVIGSVLLQSDLSELILFRQQITVVVAGSLATVFFLSWILSFWLQKLISRPIERLTSMVRHISHHRDYSLRATDIGKDEIGILANAFNEMLSEVELRDEKLKEREKRTQEYLNIADVMIVSLDNKGRVSLINPKGCKILGMEEEDILGKDWFEHFVPERLRKSVHDLFSEVATGGKLIENFENPVLTSSGEERLIAWHNIVIRDDAGNLISVLSSGKDITEQREAQIRESSLREQLGRAERLETVGVLAGGVAHDLNNILGPLVMLPDLLEDDLKQTMLGNQAAFERVTSSIDMMRTSGNKAAGVVKELLTLSRRGHYELKPIDIGTIPSMNPESTFLRLLQDAHPHVSIAFNLDPTPLIILASENHLSRVIENLTRNAVESIKGKGLVTISTAKRQLGSEYAGYTIVPPGDYALIEIRDNGCGIEPDDMSRIFEPFYTNKQQSESSGSGLGLSVVHGIVGDHKGYIDVASKVGKGTVFSLFLPLAKGVENSGEETNDCSVDGKANILVVDDEQSQRFLARAALTRWGFTVDLAENGRTAVALFVEAKDRKEPSPYDLVILDMRMEPDFDGLDTLIAIRERYPNQTILIASGHAEDDRSAKALSLGANWLAKPYTLNQLQNAIGKLLD